MPLFPDTPLLGPSQTIQTVLASDTTTTSTNYVNLLTHQISVQEGSYLLVRASFSTSDSTSSSSDGNQFRLTVDDVDFGYGGSEIYNPCSQSGSICAKAGPLVAGVHTVNLDWATGSGNTLRCRPVTQQEQATLISTEVTDYQVGG